MKILTAPIDHVLPWDKNPRNIKTKDMERLKKQIQQIGIYKPLICYKENGKYITLGGNMRLRALNDLGYQSVEISLVEPKTEAEKVAINLSDNDRAGEYDEQALAELTYEVKDEMDSDLFKIDLGNSVSIENLLTQYGPKIEAGEEDALPEPEPSEPISKPGELYKLGKHRLLCGDATKPWAEAWQRFMVEWGGGLIVLALKYKANIEKTKAAVKEAGGLYHLAKTRPWIFDFIRKTPLPGYQK